MGSDYTMQGPGCNGGGGTGWGESRKSRVLVEITLCNPPLTASERRGWVAKARLWGSCVGGVRGLCPGRMKKEPIVQSVSAAEFAAPRSNQLEASRAARPEDAALPPAITSARDLVAAGLAQDADIDVLEKVAAEFRIRISSAMVANPGQGIHAQFMPQAAELDILPEELADPIGDDVHRPVQGLTHRYPDRVILHSTQTCEVYCRFCFRREAVGEAGSLSDQEFDRVLAYLRDHPQIWEVILTGGDPMVLSARRLKKMLAQLAEIPSVQVIRFHTRIPVVAPEKITDDLVSALQIRPAVWVVVHTNHVDEITPAAEAAFARLTRAGVPLLSQSVLLRGVNADADSLEALFRALIRNRVKPYYLHHPDLAKGTSHFRLTIAEGQKIFAALRGRISGTALPTYILDIPGGHGKVPIGPDYLQQVAPKQWIVTDPNGKQHIYRDL